MNNVRFKTYAHGSEVTLTLEPGAGVIHQDDEGNGPGALFTSDATNDVLPVLGMEGRYPDGTERRS